jgi:transformation/transcription domain-associated protein
MLATAMETMIDEIVTRLKPTPEEELLRTLQVLLTECYKQALQAMDRPMSPVDTPVSASVATHFRRLLQSFFSTGSIMSYRARFEEDFANVETVGLDTCLTRLQKWHQEFAGIVARMPRHYRLEELSRFLTNFSASYADIELPGEHLERRSPQVRRATSSL